MRQPLKRICKCGAPASKYVYPLPGSTDPWAGALMCPKCAAEAIAELEKVGHFSNGNGHYPIEAKATAEVE